VNSYPGDVAEYPRSSLRPTNATVKWRNSEISAIWIYLVSPFLMNISVYTKERGFLLCRKWTQSLWNFSNPYRSCKSLKCRAVYHLLSPALSVPAFLFLLIFCSRSSIKINAAANFWYLPESYKFLAQSSFLVQISGICFLRLIYPPWSEHFSVLFCSNNWEVQNRNIGAAICASVKESSVAFKIHGTTSPGGPSAGPDPDAVCR
jgi:hypothetical protein